MVVIILLSFHFIEYIYHEKPLLDKQSAQQVEYSTSISLNRRGKAKFCEEKNSEEHHATVKVDALVHQNNINLPISHHYRFSV